MLKVISLVFLGTVAGYFVGMETSKYKSLNSIAVEACKQYPNAHTGLIDFDKESITVFCKNDSYAILK